jgi:hypothetical protein
MNLLIWPEIFFLLFGLFCLVEGLYFLKIGDAFVPIIHIYKDENPFAFWVVVCFWLGMGLFLLIIGFAMLFLV